MSSQPKDCIAKVNNFPFDVSVPKPDIPVGGHLKFFKSQWYKITKDPHLLQMVSACPLHITNPIPCNNSVREIKMNKIETEAACAHIQELLKKKAIIPCEREEIDFMSNVFLVPKKDAGF